VEGEQADVDDERLTVEERQGLREAVEGLGDGGDLYAYITLPVDDPRCALPETVNNAALCLADLNHDPEALNAVLLTSFDLVEDVGWLRDELRLDAATPLTFCMHPWPQMHLSRDRLLRDLDDTFHDCVAHFPGGIANAGCSVHAKLMLLEFRDRLRVVVSSANLRPLHWSFSNEVVWVQDFPRAAWAQGPPDVRRLLRGGEFGRTLAHFVSELLTGAERGRQEDWARRLALFDFEGASADLISSRQGWWAPAPRGAPAATLRLGVDVADEEALFAMPAEARPRRARLVPARRGWELRYADDGAGGLWRLARLLGVHRWRLLGRLRFGPCCEALDAALAWGFELPRHVEVELEQYYDYALQRQRFVLEARVVLGEGAAPQAASPGLGGQMAALLAQLEVNYGLHALGERLSARLPQEACRPSEEVCYIALATFVDEWRGQWFEDIDRVIGRDAARTPSQRPGPLIVAPGGDGWLWEMYRELEQEGRLVEHGPPGQAPGRELLKNHSKLIARHFWCSERGSPYGWVYAGSHNLTRAAWGSFGASGERLWVRNRELGVLLVEPRPQCVRTGDSLFAQTPLPFELPPRPADLSHRELRQYTPPEDGDWWDNGGQWSDAWGGWWPREEDEWSSSDEGDDEYFGQGARGDWRLRKRSWWWWT